MIQFIKDSIRELKHVVWPTRKETQKYFFLVVSILIVFGLYLFLFSNLFSNIIFGLKDIFGIDAGPSGSINSSLTDEEIEALFSDEATLDVQTEIDTQETSVSEDIVESEAQSGAITE